MARRKDRTGSSGSEHPLRCAARAPRWMTALLILVLVFGVAFILFGIARGELPVVAAKAGSVCYQCIGIG